MEHAVVFDDSLMPVGPTPEPLPVPHFHDRLHAVVWRNWELVDTARLASTLGATEDEIRRIAVSLGLPERATVPDATLVSATIIRRNWHLLPYRQIASLLGWSADELAYALREDDFLYYKLGSLKPAAAPLRYEPIGVEARERAADIRAIVEELERVSPRRSAARPYDFLEAFGSAPDRSAAAGTPPTGRDGVPPLRLIYSYVARYGDPLSDSGSDPFPERYLDMLAESGINGVWLQAVLYTLHRWELAPVLSRGAERRLERLAQLVERTARHGIGLYLYLNEPRSMREEFFRDHPELRGVRDRHDPGYSALCTSNPAVLDYLFRGAGSIFSAVPGLAGAFTISMSENLTHCRSKGGGDECPQCRTRSAADLVVEVNRALADGVHSAKPDARFIVWDWGWSTETAGEAIPRLRREVSFMSVSEWDLPISRGGVESRVGEYSLSAPGPGPRAKRHWALAAEHGIPPVAKMQINNTWELSSVPWLPVVTLVAEHIERLAKEGVRDVMMSWTLGGYPSANIEVARRLLDGEARSADEAVRMTAAARFGAGLACDVVAAWRCFGEAFREFPYHIGVLYRGPQQFGPANFLYPEATGYESTMIGFPYDDLDGWRSIYPPDVFLRQFERLERGWEPGVTILREAADRLPGEAIRELLRVAEACLLTWRSVRCQVEYVMVRESNRSRSRSIIEEEIGTAAAMLAIVDSDSRIGYEASNQYYFTRWDLIEKIISCRRLLSELSVG